MPCWDCERSKIIFLTIWTLCYKSYGVWAAIKWSKGDKKVTYIQIPSSSACKLVELRSCNKGWQACDIRCSCLIYYCICQTNMTTDYEGYVFKRLNNILDIWEWLVYVYVLYGGGGEGGVFNTLTLFFTCKSKHYHFLAILKNLFCIYSLYLYLILKFVWFEATSW